VRVALDTNVLISGLISPDGPPGRIVDLIRSGALCPVVDDRILAEYREVLRRPYFRKYLTALEVEDILEYLTNEADYSSSRVVVTTLQDPSDAPFLEIALTEDIVLVTGNIKHFPRHLRRSCVVLTPREFLQMNPF
jgi:putative PIN family toxin of toxin-antitoxin system